MKVSLALSVILAVVFLGIGWKNHTELTDGTRRYRAVAKLAGVPDGGVEHSTRKRPREKRGTEVAQTIALALNYLKSARQSGEEDSAEKSQRLDLNGQIDELNGPGLLALATALEGAEEIGGNRWEPLIGLVLRRVSEEYPRECLALFKRRPELAEKLRHTGDYVKTSLRVLAEEDPAAALNWLRGSEKSKSHFADASAKGAVVSGIAANDPVRAFKTAEALGVNDPRQLVDAIFSGDLAGRQKEMLEGLRWYLGQHEDEDARLIRQNSINRIVGSLSYQGFATAEKWLVQNPLSQEERSDFASGLSHGGNYDDAGKWLPWISSNLPRDLADPQISQMILRWTKSDSLAAGGWLAEQAPGDLRNVAAAAYAGQIASASPYVAAQWAATLPPGPLHTKTIQEIRSKWPKTDLKGAAAFAKVHGLE